MALTCELCESTDVLKEDGMFVCQGCGTKYTVEEAKKLLSGGGSEGAAGGSARQDKIDNYLTLATNALDSSNNSEAENYASKVLELDANNARAWLIKGEANGYTSGYYEDQSLTAAAKNIRRNQISKYEKDAKDKIRKKKEAEEKKRREEQEKRNKEYWDAHAEEKVALEARKAELTEQIKPLAKEHSELKVQLANIQKKANVPVAATKELEEHRKQIGALVAEKSALGIFKGKEKKALQEKIDAMEAQVPALQEKIKQQEAEQKAAVSAEAEPVATKMQAVFAEQQKLQKELDGVEKELTMNR